MLKYFIPEYWRIKNKLEDLSIDIVVNEICFELDILAVDLKILSVTTNNSIDTCTNIIVLLKRLKLYNINSYIANEFDSFKMSLSLSSDNQLIYK